MTTTQVYVDAFMQSLAGEEVALNSQLQTIFARILSRQVTVNYDEEEDTYEVETTATFDNLASIFTYVAVTNPGERPPGGPFGYTASLEDAKASALQIINPDPDPGDDGKNDPGDDLDFEDGDGKVELPVPGFFVTETSGVTASTAQSADVIDLSAFRSDSRFSGIDGEGMAVVVIDTGIDLDHPAFGPDANGDGISDRIVYTEDFSSDVDGTADDVDGHGSNVASIIGSENNAYLGVAPGVDIIALQGLGNNGNGRSGDIEKALQWVVNNALAYNVVAVNLSLGSYSNLNSAAPLRGWSDELAALDELGVITVSAAGNDYFDFQAPGASSLSADPHTIPVGAVYDQSYDQSHGKISWNGGAEDNTTGVDRVISISQRSDALPTVFAPGAIITGAAPGGGASSMGGTSQAAPHIAGVAALAQDLALSTLGRRLTVSEFETLLSQTGNVIFDGDDEDDNVVNTNAEYSRVNVLNLAEAILDMDEDEDDDVPIPPPPSGDDYPGDRSTPASLTIGSNISGTLETAYDQDWFQVSLTAGQTYTFNLQGSDSSSGTLSDPYITLANNQGLIVAHDDDSGNGLESELEVTPNQSGTYFVGARAYSSEIGTYLLSSTTSAPPAPADIPGDSSTSERITAALPISETLDYRGDTDWFSATLSASNNYQIDLQGLPSGSGTLRDPLVRVYDSNGQIVRMNDDGGIGFESSLHFSPVSDGTYYISAEAYAGAYTGTYLLSLTEFPNDIPGDSSTSASIASKESVQGTLEEPGDTDWYRLEVQAGTVYTISLDGTGQDKLDDPLLRVFDASESAVDSDDDGGEGLNSALTFTAKTSETLYVSAEAFAGLYTGDYLLAVTALTTDDAPADTSAPEPLAFSNLRTNPSATNASIQGELEIVDDQDWFQIYLEADTRYHFDLEGSATNEGTLTDPVLGLYNTNGDFIASDDDGGEGLNSRISDYSPTSDGYYFLEARGFGNDSTGTYALSVSRVGSPPDPYNPYISESLTEDTSGYDSHYDTINDVLLLPDAKIGVVTPDTPTDAYLHISAGERRQFDYDTFLLEFDTSGDYRLVITPEDESLFQSNKIIWLWDDENDPYGDLIMNQVDGFVAGSLYSDIFSAEAGDSKYVSVSMRWDGGYPEVATGPAPYEIELLGVLNI